VLTRDCTTKVKNVVVTRLMGGLGNQLFQYAAARAVALRRGVTLRLDTSWYVGRRDRSYVLSHFDIRENLLSPREMRLLRYWTDDGRHAQAKRAVSSLLPLLRVTRISDPPGAADPSIFPTSRRLLLDGFWQSPVYFDEIGDVIRREFRLKAEPDERTAEIVGRMSACESVSVHVRRGDYVTDRTANRVHGTCGIEYYDRAAKIICEKIDSPRFFVFSDDSDAARRELRLPGPTEFIDRNADGRDWEDLRLMRSCRHHVIANSSFSWWGAWLAHHDEQIVIAPHDWYRPGAKPGHRIRDLIPQSWDLVEVPQ